ncbi:MAG: hypothetical protein M1816_000893 [Peltula sp. TS41687]|nr:MAG: hypothetical protein M1816_000893 [Peltula sp. TS41687]
MLDTLPMEIVETIVDLFTDKRDLKNMCEVSKRLYEITVPKLYETIIIQTEDELYLERLNVEPLLRTCSNPLNCLQFVKNIRITAPFHRNLRNRCLHDRFDEEDDVCWLRCPFHGRMERVSGPKKPSVSQKLVRKDLESDEDNLDADIGDSQGDTDDEVGTPDDVSIGDHEVYEDLEDGLMPLFVKLKENNLRTFSWELGTCVPYKLLGPNGYLPEKQNQIRALTLKTAGMCGTNMEGESPLHLPYFNKLKCFSWAAPRSAVDFEAIQEVLKANSDHLEELYLDLVDWVEADDSWFNDRGLWTVPRSPNFFAQEILGLSSRDEEKKGKVMLPALRDLTLSALSFQSVPKKLACFFNFSALHSLKLRYCPCTRALLEVLTGAKEGIKLTSLELILFEDEWDDLEDVAMDPVKPFLESFEGLEDLSLVIVDPMGVEDDYWSPIFHHQRTLKRFVYHERAIDIEEDSATFELLRDMEFPGGNSGDYDNFDELKLECIGLSGSPRVMRATLEPLGSKRTLKLLHIRRTGSDLRDGTNPDDLGDRYSGDGSYDTHMERLRDLSDLHQSQHSDGKIRNKGFPPALAEFAQWAFGPTGYPALQVLAYGDFSYEGRYERYNLLLCRRESPSLPKKSSSTGKTTAALASSSSEEQTNETSAEGQVKDSVVEKVKETAKHEEQARSGQPIKETSGEEEQGKGKSEAEEAKGLALVPPINPFALMMQAQRVIGRRGRPAKSALTFRMMTMADEERLLDGIDAVKGARAFLTACPIDPILES